MSCLGLVLPKLDRDSLLVSGVRGSFLLALCDLPCSCGVSALCALALNHSNANEQSMLQVSTLLIRRLPGWDDLRTEKELRDLHAHGPIGPQESNCRIQPAPRYSNNSNINMIIITIILVILIIIPIIEILGILIIVVPKISCFLCSAHCPADQGWRPPR